MSLWQTRLRWREIARSRRPAELKVALLATFTVNPLVPYLGVALEEQGLPADLWVGPYDQVVQELTSAESDTARFRPRVVVVWLRLEELWRGRPLPLRDGPSRSVEEAVGIADAVAEGAKQLGADLIFVLPAIPELRPLGMGDACNPDGVFAVASAVREAVRHRLASQPGVLLVDAEEAIRRLGDVHSYNPRTQALAHIPFSEELFHQLGGRLGRLITLGRRSAKKVIVTDADKTLWGGIVGEDGPDGIDLGDNGPGEAHRDYQSFLLEMRRAGALLALCSKNEEADVWHVFARREMQLRKEHLAAWRIGWQPKSQMIREIAEELQLGPSSFVFIDDNPAEIAEVKSVLPEVECILMPEEPADWHAAVCASGVLDRLPPTAEDLERPAFYEQERTRSEIFKRASSPDEYLAQLGVAASIFPPAPADLSRLAQMIAKTNQFNLNCQRRSEAELASLCGDERFIVRLIDAQDRFGKYGVVGAFIVDLGSSSPVLDTFLLSCRAMGRGLEEAMIASIFEEVARNDHLAVHATVRECPRNQPARQFFARLGCEASGVTSPLKRLDWPPHLARL